MSASIGESIDHLLAARSRSGRLGEHWPQGPVIESTEAVVAPADYAGWIREAQTGDEDLPFVVHHVRRTRASRYSRAPLPPPSPASAAAQRDRGRRVDDLLGGDAAEEPLAWDEDGANAATVDRIAGTGYLSGPDRVDVGRLFSALDGAFAGSSAVGLVAHELSGVPAEALAGWVGDLAAWMLAWDRRRRDALAAGRAWQDADSDAALAEAQREEAPLEAMLGSFDGQVLADWYDTTVFGGFGGALPAGDAIERYYATALDPTTDPPVPLVGDRFVRFAATGVPRLTNPADAAVEVGGHVLRAAAALLYLGRRGGWLKQGPLASGERPAEDLATATAMLAPHEGIAATIAERFAALLRAGLEGRQLPADWPRST